MVTGRKQPTGSHCVFPRSGCAEEGLWRDSLVCIDVHHVGDEITLNSDERARGDLQLETSGGGGGVVVWSGPPCEVPLTAH
ncbi:hypothetical protein E1301_Tti008274 [Triplophysa tibetana]|uniref:Uncharacterized protein n=1 Tax=Triplophysa tibetana TaxID=1572043 RepID=A0A5A9PGM4_9TELE|nr:hypothetical protein E1301_Tti008274 [Triplophysa tibetana]